MSRERILLVEIGTPADLPVVTPPAPRPPSAWVPDSRPSPGLPPPTGLAVASIADAAVLTWTPSPAGGQTVIESAPNMGGAPGVWREAGRTGVDSYTLSLPDGARWVRVRAELNGRTSVATNAVLAEPIDVGGSISEFEQELRDIADLVDTVAAQAAADAAALNVRADDLRADIDATIAEVSTLADLTDDLGTEITRVETESVARDTATVETISLLGAKNGAGTAFILDGNTVRLGPTESLAQWRSSIQGEFASQSSRIDNEVQARQDGDQALATTLATVQATANNAATKAELTAAETALAAADVAEANARNALAVQLRGGYTGTNPASLTQGLIYNERQARITAEGAIASTVDAMQLDLNGKASASDLAATQLAVTQQGNTLTAHGQQLSGLSASVGDNEASINELREVAVSGNAIEQPDDPSFEGNVPATWNAGAALPFQVMVASYEARSGSRALRIGWGRGFTVTLPNSRQMPVREGESLRVGFWARTSGSVPSNGAQVYIGLWYTTASGGYVDYRVGPSVTSNGVNSFDYREFSRTVTVPPGAANLQLRIVAPNWGSGWFHIDDVYVARPGAILSEMLAKYTLAVQAGGYVAGMQLLAGGGTSAIRFLADSVDVVDPGGASGWSLVGGIATWRKGSHMVVIGPGFGANSEFMYWSGPIQSSLANCRRNNAIRYETVTGESFQRGGIIAGTRVHSGFNPALAVPSIYTTPSLGTGGNPIAITASVSYFRQFSTNNNAGRFTPGSGSNTATLQLWRKIGSGAWSMVSSQPFTGSLQITGEPTTSDQALWNINGAITFTDTAGGTQNRQYEARLVTRTLQAVSVQNPVHSIVPVAEQQSVGIVTEEDP